jgi:coenzyme F420-reducing hydrogenase delta subunit
LVVEEVDTIIIDGCTFKNCRYKYGQTRDCWSKLGGVIYADNASKVKLLNITNSSFLSCGGINTYDYYKSAFISNINSNVENCQFNDCWHYYYGNKKDPGNEKRTMFPSNSQATNCTFEDSALFC